MQDVSSERSILSSIIKHGDEAFIEASYFLDGADDFSNHYNRSIYKCLCWINAQSTNDYGYEMILLAAKSLGLDSVFKEQEKSLASYIDALTAAPPAISSIKTFCHEVKKWKVCRDLLDSTASIATYLNKEVNENTKIPEIIEACEKHILNYIDGASDEPLDNALFSDVTRLVNDALTGDMRSQVGISTGFPLHDELIGGGPRKGGTSFIFARPKVGKTSLAYNIANNVAKLGIPVLYLDTEMNKDVTATRILCMESGVGITDFETGRFRTNPHQVQSVKTISETIRDLNIAYENIAGKSIGEILSICRRWLTKKVGFNENGKAKQCLIIYDYFKLTTDDGIGNNMSEWLKLGMMLNALNTFLIKYEIPCRAFGQMNRSGIEGEDGGVIAGSDRILWFCNDFSVLRNKTEEDGNLGCGWEYGNKYLKVIETRYGPGMPHESDYINLKAKIRPMCPNNEATGKIEEGKLYTQVISEK
jgi:replicative DNA helicase